MTRDNKVQLGARVPAQVREKARDASLRDGVSLNVWVERAILHAVDGVAMNVTAPQVIPGQITVEEALEVQEILEVAGTAPAVQPQIVKHDHSGGVSRVVSDPTPFAKNCKNGTYHFKHGPGDPCRYCGGGI